MENQFHIDVFSKKMHQKTYHLATFKEPLTKGIDDELPAHIIEKKDPPPPPPITEQEKEKQ